MSKSIYYFAILIFLRLFIACEKEIQFRPKDQRPFLVMNSFLSPDSVWKVSVSQSISVANKMPNNIVSDAVVKVYGNEILLETLKFNEVNSSYIGIGKPLVGKEYKILIEKNGFLPVEATSHIEPTPEVLSAGIMKDSLNRDHAFATITFNDQTGVKNFYRLVVANEDEFGELPAWAQNYHNSSRSGWIGNTYVDYDLGIRTNDPNLRWDNQSSSAGLFDDVPNNIFCIFNDELIDGKTYSLTFSYSLSGYPEARNNTVIYLQSITEELYKYLKSLSAQYYFGDDPLLEPIQVYSNVKNGGGILGGYNSNKVIINVDDLESKQY